jgi:hypothetical protein
MATQTIRRPLVYRDGQIEESENSDLVESNVGLPETTIGDEGTATTSWAQITAVAYTLQTPARIQADQDNTNNIAVGFKNDPATGGDPIQIAELDPGAFRVFDEVNEPRKLYVKVDSGTEDFFWSAGTA